MKKKASKKITADIRQLQKDLKEILIDLMSEHCTMTIAPGHDLSCEWSSPKAEGIYVRGITLQAMLDKLLQQSLGISSELSPTRAPTYTHWV